MKYNFATVSALDICIEEHMFAFTDIAFSLHRAKCLSPELDVFVVPAQLEHLVCIFYVLCSQ